MRRIGLAAIAVLALVLAPATIATAAPTPAASVPVPAAVPGQPICTIDSSLAAMVGLAATANGYFVAVRSNTDQVPVRLYQLNSSCQRTGSPMPYNGGSGAARNPQDLQISANGGTLWVGDSGDSLQSPERETIGLWKLPTNGSRGTLYHFVYPSGDGPHDAEALLLNGDGTPIFVTRALSGPAGIYVPAGALKPDGSNVALRKAGVFTPQRTGSPNNLGPQGNLMVTGGADSPDGKRVALRTLSDAYEWDVAGGDVIKALTTGTPRITPLVGSQATGLSGEPLGSAIAYSHNGASFLTLSDFNDSTKDQILKYTPSKPATAKATVGGAKATPKADTRSWFSKLSLKQVTDLVAVVGVIGLLMVIGGILGIQQARKRPRPAPGAGPGGGGGGPWDDPNRPGGPPATAKAAVPVEAYQRQGAVYGAADRHPAGGPPPGGGRPGEPAGRPGPPPGQYGTPRGPYGEPRDPRGDQPRNPPGEQRGNQYGSPGGRGEPRAGSPGGRGEPRAGRAESHQPAAAPARPPGNTYVAGGGPPGGGPASGGPAGGGGRPPAAGPGRAAAPVQPARRQPPHQPPRVDQPPLQPPRVSQPPYVPPPVLPPPAPRGDGGIARSHRPEGRRAPRGAPPPRNGYSEEHDGFGDLRDLTEQDGG